jgi:hypothetical protein
VATADSVVEVPAYAVEAVDTTGCGDAFSVGCLRGLSLGRTPAAAAALGCATAAHVAQVRQFAQIAEGSVSSRPPCPVGSWWWRTRSNSEPEAAAFRAIRSSMRTERASIHRDPAALGGTPLVPLEERQESR